MDAVLAGRSDHVVLPQSLALVAPLMRAYPHFLQVSLRNRMVRLMRGWRGRQVVQPSEEKVDGASTTAAGASAQRKSVGDKGASDKGVGESTVLVERESSP